MSKEEIIANCIDEILAGNSTLEDCLARYPYLGDELRSLLEIAGGIQPEVTAPTNEFKWRARARLVETMQYPAVDAERSRPDVFGWLRLLVPAKGLSYTFITAALVLALFISGGTTVYASQESLPDDVLYPVKTGVENLRLALTRTPEARASLHLELAERRIEEVVAQSRLGRDITVSALENAAVQTDAAIKEMGSLEIEDNRTLVMKLSESTISQQIALNEVSDEIPEAARPSLKKSLNALRRGNLIARVSYGNPEYLKDLPSVADEKLEAAYFKLEGTLLGAEGETWNIGGLLLTKVNSSRETPPVGNRVDVEGLVQEDVVFISKIELEEGVDDTVKIEGAFGGTSPDGTSWLVGGIPVVMPRDMPLPQQGSHLELAGIVQNGTFNVTESGSEEVTEKEEKEVKIDGTLVQVEPGDNVIIIEVAGAHVTVNISQAVISNKNGEPLTLLDLESMVGEDIQVRGLFMKDGSYYAKSVYVNISKGLEPAGVEKVKDKDKDQDKDMGKDKGKEKDRGKSKDEGKNKNKEAGEDGDGDKDEDTNKGKDEDKENGKRKGKDNGKDD